LSSEEWETTGEFEAWEIMIKFMLWNEHFDYNIGNGLLANVKHQQNSYEVVIRL
jgi:hypothetical protein